MPSKLSAAQRRRMLKLLYMRYTLEEIARETDVPLKNIEQACQDGCPHKTDEAGTWVIGTDFQAWMGIHVHSSMKRPNPRGLIHRGNFQEVKAFLDYRIKVLQLDSKSIRNRWIELRHLLEWAGPTRLTEAPSIDPFFPTYLAMARNDGKSQALGATTRQRVCMGSRLFFEWAKQELPANYRPISDTWIKALRPAKSLLQSQLQKRDAWELTDVLKIAHLSVSSLQEKRAQAAICFLYLSGMRITAFLTLPLSCVDVENRRIEQLPSKGVITKNRKAAITTLLPIPELLEIVRVWDDMVRTRLPTDSPWFAYLNAYDHLIRPEKELQDRLGGRRMACTEGMKHLCALAGVPYKLPHKLRHGHAVYGIKHARDMHELKAISQNLMHSSISITDGIYGNLTHKDIQETIAGLDRNTGPFPDVGKLLQAMIKLQNDPDLLQRILKG